METVKKSLSAPAENNDELPDEDDCTDRDTSLKNIQKYVSPKYQIRWYMDSLGGDTPAFCIGLTSHWEQLEQRGES